MTMIIELAFIVVFLVLFYILDEPLLFAVLALLSTVIMLDVMTVGNNFFTIPAGLQTWFSLIWVFLSLVGWSKLIKIARHARRKYQKYSIEDDY